MYFKYVRMNNIYQTYSFSSMIDSNLIKMGMDKSLLDQYNEFLNAEYITETKIMFRPRLENIIRKRSPVTMLYERIDSIIYDVFRKRVISIMTPDVSIRRSIRDMLYLYNKDKESNIKRDPLKAYEFVKGYTFHLYAEPLEYNSSLSDELVTLDMDSGDEWDLCKDNDDADDALGIKNTKVCPEISDSLTISSNSKYTDDNIDEKYTWDIMPDTILSNNMSDNEQRQKFNNIKIEFFRTFNIDLQELLDPTMCYTVRFQHPNYHNYTEIPMIYVLESYKIENDFEVIRQPIELQSKLIHAIETNNEKGTYSYPLSIPKTLGNVQNIDDLVKIRKKMKADMPGILLVDNYYSEKSVLFNNSFYKRRNYTVPTMRDVEKRFINGCQYIKKLLDDCSIFMKTRYSKLSCLRKCKKRKPRSVYL